MTHTDFKAFGLTETLIKALARQSITTPTPIQAQAIPAVMDGRDVLGIAQTGTGKTAAFALPVVHQMLEQNRRPAPKNARALILAPTRELASQIADNIKSMIAGTPLALLTVFGGVSLRPQIDALRKGIDILVATPGRLLDLVEQRAVSLSDVRFVVLDEADRMLDMGFVRDVMRIVGQLPKERQSLLFSATMPRSIEDLAAKILTKPIRVEVTPEIVTVEKIDQSVYLIPQKAKKLWLIEHLATPDYDKTVIFTRTKHGANRLSEDLEKSGIKAVAIHGNKSQAARQKALAAFHSGQIRVLVATDIVARGIHVDDISHVVNFDLPEEPESYVHRIGRTARAGKSGIAVALVDPSERSKLRAIEKLTGQKFEIHQTNYAAQIDLSAPETDTRPARSGRPQNRFGGAGKPAGQRPAGQRPKGPRDGENRGARPSHAPGGENRAAKPAGRANNNRRRSGGGGGQRSAY
ncbi:DEAD/DEAH box helicase [Aurantimonas sp. Leaf443]|uniref:DEAD/DEAH box helicase n=1 Tax=Aurantimonas sp. Leaf443 TaxID=1736378 RepID=UPI0006F265E5|nr:DEAD/DEAH box helicase [Aurantimonas sp. Leaf443]KQT82462.1 DEAD/DEAH box helicase [Aurantimonas sp. Leaf443]